MDELPISWRKLESWLEVGKWSPTTAAHILIDLDPDTTRGACETNGFAFGWLTDCRPVGLPLDTYSIEKNLEMLLEHSMWLTYRANAAKVQTPHEWLHWCVLARLEPAWLKPALGVKSLRPLLPIDLPSYREAPARSETIRDVARLGGDAKAFNSPAGKAKALLLPLIRAGLEDGTIHKNNNRVEDFVAILRENSGAHAGYDTIRRWIAAERKRHVLADAAACPHETSDAD